MPVPSRTVGALVRWGIRYAPIAYAGWRGSTRSGVAGGWRAERDTEDEALKRAADHATQLIDGSVLQVFHGDTRVWVVFSGDHPVGSHPVVKPPLTTLLEHYDLTKRVRPEQLSPTSGSPPPGRGVRRWSSQRLRPRRRGWPPRRSVTWPPGAQPAGSDRQPVAGADHLTSAPVVPTDVPPEGPPMVRAGRLRHRVTHLPARRRVRRPVGSV